MTIDPAQMSITVNKPEKAERTHENGLPLRLRSKESVLVQNKGGAYRFVPKEQAIREENEGKLVILKPSDPDYIEGTEIALGVGDGFKPGDAVQIAGKLIHADELGRANPQTVIEAAKEAVKKYEADKETGLVHAKELPEDLKTFEGKSRNTRRGNR